MAHRIFMDYEIRSETNTLVQSCRFRDVAEKTIENMQSELLHGGGKVIYKDYIGALRKYHIPTSTAQLVLPQCHESKV